MWIERGPWWRYRSYENRVVIQTRFGVDGEWHTVTHRATVEEAVALIEKRRMPAAYLNDRETVVPIERGHAVRDVMSGIAQEDLCD